MSRLENFLEGFLIKAGALKPVVLGTAPAKISVTPEVKERLMERLFIESKLHNRILMALMAVHFLIIIAAFCLVYFYRNDLTSTSVILGGSGSILSLLGITRSLSNLWRTKMAVDVLIAILPSLSTEQAIQAVKDLYYAQSKSSTDAPRVGKRSKTLEER
jgi:hypothetical protein